MIPLELCHDLHIRILSNLKSTPPKIQIKPKYHLVVCFKNRSVNINSICFYLNINTKRKAFMKGENYSKSGDKLLFWVFQIDNNLVWCFHGMTQNRKMSVHCQTDCSRINVPFFQMLENHVTENLLHPLSVLLL